VSTSKAGTALAVLQTNAGMRVGMSEIAGALGYPDDPDGRNRASMLVATAVNRAGKSSPWRHVTRVGKGLYVYDDTPPPPPPEPWSEVAAEGDTFVLRSPDGRLYIARPLTEETS